MPVVTAARALVYNRKATETKVPIKAATASMVRARKNLAIAANAGMTDSFRGPQLNPPYESPAL